MKTIKERKYTWIYVVKNKIDMKWLTQIWSILDRLIERCEYVKIAMKRLYIKGENWKRLQWDSNW